MIKMPKVGHDNAREECGKALQVQKKYLQAGDLKEAERELYISDITLRRYMSGKVANLSTGITMLTHFRKVLDRRLARLRLEIRKTNTVTSALDNLKKPPTPKGEE